MSSADVRAILDLPRGGAKPAAQRKQGLQRKPDGISRELYALMGDNAPSLSTAAPLERVRDRSTAKHVQWYDTRRHVLMIGGERHLVH